ncbi:MAG: hypothetical protein DI528_07610 [Shinella sp.]|nr:MAG: hypothetical protein DI528_07610 [Shinella sp.]
MNPEHDKETLRPKAGDRLWFWSAEEPSEFEKVIANSLKGSQLKSEIFHVKVYGWSGAAISEIYSDLSVPVELPQDRLVAFLEIGEKMSVKVPSESLMRATDGALFSININHQDYTFHNQILVIVAASQKDHDDGYATLRGASDIFGYLALIFGSSISNEPIISCYFNTSTEKFLTSRLQIRHDSDLESETFGIKSFFDLDRFRLQIRHDSDLESETFGIKSFFDLDRFSGEDDNIHASLWFVGKAYSENNRAVKIVFYQTAVEMLYGSKEPHKGFRKLYQGRSGAHRATDAVIRLRKLRTDLVHKGMLGDFPHELERSIQLLLLDAIVEKQHGSLRNSAFFAALKLAQKSK